MNFIRALLLFDGPVVVVDIVVDVYDFFVDGDVVVKIENNLNFVVVDV